VKKNNYRRLPHHKNVAVIHHSFTDVIPKRLPDWSSSDGITVGKCVFLVMDLYPTSLQSFLTQRRLSPSIATDTRVLSILEVAMVAHGVSSGLYHCTSHGIVHRDIKPDNILLRNVPMPSNISTLTEDKDLSKLYDFEVVITDFDCALVRTGPYYHFIYFSFQCRQ
jgi:serine/threonine protein kinase